jgi:hypothetical protein
MTAMNEPLRVIDASQEDYEEKSDWEAQIERALGSRRNFVVVFGPGGEGLRRLAEMLDCSPSVLPEKLLKWGIHGLNDVLRSEDYHWLVSVYGADDVRFVEQLHLSCNQPPSLKPYVVYCERRGVISDHAALEEARIALWQYLEEFRRTKVFPLAGIYHWENDEWVAVHQV